MPEIEWKALAHLDRELDINTLYCVRFGFCVKILGFARQDVTAALRAFAGLPGAWAESPDLTAKAIDRAEHGMDLADVLHLGADATGWWNPHRRLRNLPKPMSSPDFTRTAGLFRPAKRHPPFRP